MFWVVIPEGFPKILPLYSGKTGCLPQQGGGEEPGRYALAGLTPYGENTGTDSPNSM